MSEPAADTDRFMQQYLEEREYLQRQGAEFARSFPKVAGRLKLEEEDHPDPHVERLRQSFAFLTARIQRKLDDEMPELAQGLLSVLFPHLACPVPSMAIVEAELDPAQSIPTQGVRIPRGATFLSKPVNGEPLRFRSGAETRLWPIRVAAATVEPPSQEDLQRHPGARLVLRLGLEALGEHPFGILEITALTLHLKGAQRSAQELYEVLSTSLANVRVRSASGKRSFELAVEKLRPVGFDESEALLPYSRRSFLGYRLLQEYFAFPARFLFLELSGLERMQRWNERRIEIAFLLEKDLGTEARDMGAEGFGLGCIPLVNLFEARADPIVLQPHTSEFDVLPDAHRPLDLEVYSIQRVTGISTRTGELYRYEPFYSLRHGDQGEGPAVYWQAIRRPSRRSGDAGTDMRLALVDLDLERTSPVDQALHVELLCTNRDLPVRSRDWRQRDDFRIEGVNGVRSLRVIHGPTPALRTDLRGEVYWRLVSQLALNHLSLVREGKGALQETLGVYDFARSAANREQIRGIRDVRSRQVVRWVRGEGGAGHCRGMETTLVLDRRNFVGGSPFLFAAVLERFLALYCAINSFSEFVLETVQDGGVVHRWKPRAGEQAIL